MDSFPKQPYESPATRVRAITLERQFLQSDTNVSGEWPGYGPVDNLDEP